MEEVAAVVGPFLGVDVFEGEAVVLAAVEVERREVGEKVSREQ